MRRVILLSWLMVGCGEAEPIAEALWPCTRQVEPMKEDPAGTFHRVTATGSDARCNDGSPPVMWVEPATDPAHAKDWVLYLEGGSSCNDQASCEDRWCGSAEVGSPWSMSSIYASERRSGAGMFGDNQADATRGWNKVTLHYCTSDRWLGTAPAPVTLETSQPHLDVWFQGHDVLMALLDALDTGPTSDDGEIEVGALAQANHILLVGSSAGGEGVTHHLDLVADRYDGTWVRGVVEGTSSIDRRLFDADTHFLMDQRLMMRVDFDEAIWNPRYEADCSDAMCADAFLLYTEAVSTPFVVRHDLRDEAFIEMSASIGLSEDEAGKLMATSARTIAEERPDVSVVETNCGRHILVQSPDYYDLLVGDAATGDEPVSLNDAVALMLEDVQVVAIDSSPASTSVCP